MQDRVSKMATHITLPLKISFQSWATSLFVDFPDYEIPIPPKDEEGWRDWAYAVIYDNNIKNVPIPDKITYPDKKDWITWAEFFINSVYTYT